jgi:hypothetical protein
MQKELMKLLCMIEALIHSGELGTHAWVGRMDKSIAVAILLRSN